MEERVSFWKGVAVGALGGLAFGALTKLLRGEAELKFEASNTGAQGGTGKLRGDWNDLSGARLPQTSLAEESGEVRANKLTLRRDAAESAGDPRVTRPGYTSADAQDGAPERAFERAGGAPGGRSPAERLEVPGRPGQQVDLGAGEETGQQEAKRPEADQREAAPRAD